MSEMEKRERVERHQLLAWLGSDVKQHELVSILFDIVNGDYDLEALYADIKSYEGDEQ